MSKPSVEEVENAWKQVGTTPAGRVARALLEELLCRTSNWNVSDGALRHLEGERNLARRLILLMDAEVPIARSADPKPVDRPGQIPVGRRSIGRRGNFGDDD